MLPIESHVEDLSHQLAVLLDLLDDSVVVRPNGDTFKVVRLNGALGYLPVDVAALIRDREMATRRPLPS